MRPPILMTLLSAMLLTACSGNVRDDLRSIDSPAPEGVIASVISDSSRPQGDRDQDTSRKPGELMAFAGVRPGLVIADFWPGGGYMTRLLSRVAGAGGRVYSVAPQEVVSVNPQVAQLLQSFNDDPALGNVVAYATPVNQFAAPEPLDMVWTTQNYHDFFLDRSGGLGVDSAAFNRAVFAALRPGGVFLVSDHAAEPGSGSRDSNALHRIDPDLVLSEVLAAGFVLDGVSDVLRNPGDDRTRSVFDDAIRGRTDQFVFRFRKPLS